MRGSRLRACRTVAMLFAVSALGALSASSALAASHPTLKANKHVAGFAAVAYGRGIALSGRAPQGGSQSYVLRAEQWPFKGDFRTVASGTTSGRYSIVVKPIRATRYQISVGGQTSSMLSVYVLERAISNSCNLCTAPNLPGAYTFAVTGTFATPPGPKTKGPVYFYYGLATNASTGPTFLNLVTTAPRTFKGNRFSVTINYPVTFPQGQFVFSTDYCWKDNEAKTGVGLPGNHHCGQPTINRLAYAG